MVYVFLNDGFEEIEAIAPIDIMRRAGIEVRTVATSGDHAVGSHGITVTCDCTLDEAVISDDIEAVILPGGPGTKKLNEFQGVHRLLDFAYENGKLVAAICAAPMIIGRKGFLKGRKATCFPGFENDLIGAEITGELACTDGNTITGKGAGAALEFAFAIVSYLRDSETAEKIAASIQRV